MRQDKLTTKFQDAIGSAQSIALAHDNQFMEPCTCSPLCSPIRKGLRAVCSSAPA